MIRSIALIGVFAALAFAAPFKSYDDLPAQYKDLIPAPAKEFLSGLSEEDLKILKEVTKDHAKYADEDEVLAAIRAKSPALADKVEKLHNMFKEKIEALGDEAKAFAKEIIGEFRKIQAQVISGNKPSVEDLKTKVLAGVAKYKALSDAAKADLEKQFPITASVFKNEKFQELAKKLLEKN